MQLLFDLYNRKRERDPRVVEAVSAVAAVVFIPAIVVIAAYTIVRLIR